MTSRHVCALMGAMLLLAVSLVDADAQPQWQRIAAPDSSFTVEMPALPSYTAAEYKTATGAPYTLHQYIADYGGGIYLMQTFLAPYGTDLSDANPRGLDTYLDDLEGHQWTSVRWDSHGDVNAVEAVGIKADHHEFRIYSVIKGQLSIDLSYSGPVDTAKAADVNRFIASLIIKERWGHPPPL